MVCVCLCGRKPSVILLCCCSWDSVPCAVDMDDPKAIVSPGGVGFDINCGVRLIRTNLDYKVKVVRCDRRMHCAVC